MHGLLQNESEQATGQQRDGLYWASSKDTQGLLSQRVSSSHKQVLQAREAFPRGLQTEGSLTSFQGSPLGFYFGVERIPLGSPALPSFLFPWGLRHIHPWVGQPVGPCIELLPAQNKTAHITDKLKNFFFKLAAQLERWRKNVSGVVCVCVRARMGGE